MSHEKYERRHHRVGQKHVQESHDKSLLEFNFTMTTFIIALFCFIQGFLIGSILRKN